MRPAVLLVEDEHTIARSIVRLCPCASIVHVTTADAAIAVLRSPRALELVVIDVALGSELHGGLRVLDVAYAERRSMLRVLLSATQDEIVLRRAVERHTPILPKPTLPSVLKAIICPEPPRALGEAIAADVARYQLRGQLEEVYRYAIDGIAREEMAARMNVSGTTLATYVRRLLVRTGAPTLAALRQRTMRRARGH